jgi:tRNA nucleotidyltransferase (CCA-adding enzyme)
MEDEIKIDIPAGAEHIIRTIEAAGYEAYVVGGCVRDALLLRTPNDWDITTSARPEQVKKLFSHTLDTGLKHGTITIMLDGEGYEVTTYRVDGAYLDGRHPEEVSFTNLLSEDLRRRDFTINAMAYHPERGLVDLFEGRADLERHVIRCVGDAKERFSEDALRMMRAVRFAAQLNFTIDQDTREAAKALCENLQKVSHERIHDELLKLLCSEHPGRMLDLYELGLTAQFLPEFDQEMSCEQNTKYHCYTVGVHTIKVLENTPADKIIRLAALLHDVGKLYTKTEKDGTDHFYGHAAVSAKRAEEILKDLRFDNETIKQVCTLVKYHDPRMELDGPHVRGLMHNVGVELFPQLILLMRGDMLAKSAYAQKSMGNIDRLEEIYLESLAAGDCVTLKDLAVTGRDLQEIGIPKGKRLGDILNKLLLDVIEAPEKNNREILLARALQLQKSIGE